MIIDTSQDPKYLDFMTHMTGTQDFGQCKTIGFIGNGTLVVVLYNGQDESNIGMSVAATSPKAFNRKLLRVAFGFPFIQLDLNRVTSLIRESNDKSIKLCKGLGFRLEGEMPEYYDNGDKAMMFGLLKRECNWI